ncbi:MAG: acetate kinase [Planctomycetes bacterium]|nr:acetate kinase [Planctomycetota bacterium]
MSILVINAGSSSLKFGLFDPEAREMLGSGLIDWTADPGQADLVIRPRQGEAQRSRVNVADHREAAVQALRSLGGLHPGPEAAPSVVGHRIVHGGTTFRESVRIDGEVKAAIARLGELAPLHNPPALQGIEAAESALPGVPQVAVFDTTFFVHLPACAHVYPLPYEWYTEWGIRRFGFHGISHSYCSRRAAEFLRRDPAGLRLVICHLGNGCSATAVRGGQPVNHSMGFTPMEGLMMGTRSGSVDPGILLYVQQHRGMTAGQLDQILNHKSGLLGVSGVSSDFRGVEAAADQGNPRARLALEIYAARVRSTIGALTVSLGGMDALVFTAGVGEHSASLRAAACTGLECLGVRLDPDQNQSCQPDADIAAADSPARVVVLHTQEELMIAQEARRVAGAGRRSS